MSKYLELMNRLDMTVQSPDKNIKARLTNRTQITLMFKPDTYPLYAEWTLSRQLAGLAQLLWVGRRRAARREAMGDDAAMAFEDPRNPDEARYFEKRTEIEVSAISQSGRISASMTGWTRWRFEVQPRTVRELTEGRFCADAVSVFPPMLHEYQQKNALLLDKLHRETRPEYFDHPSRRKPEPPRR